MKETRKLHRIIDIVFMLYPLIVFALYVFSALKNDNYTALGFNEVIGQLNTYVGSFPDFGLKNFINTNLDNLLNNTMLNLSYNLMVYYVWYKLLDLMLSCVFCLIDFARNIIDNLTMKGGK